MRLKRLDLLGYKTFALHTEFVFDAGVTAIVGPNGSGKSNVADAFRWVLGEQSFSLLRARKSEDMIFSGSERRARMGMAEATVTLDNSDNWLPVDFSEVAITRRSYRSGENEYLLNGSRVRLRDISDLLAQSGLSRRTYTVIGQGLVDAALSLRPQERRNLIEEAAGLTLYQSRRADALGKLEETMRNVLRVHDLIVEISPRLNRLQHQAERAREHALVRQELDRAQRVWYSYRWKHGQDELRRIRAIDRHQLERLDAQRAHVREWSEQIAELRAMQGDLRRQLSTWHSESSALHAQLDTLQRDLAVVQERRRLLIQHREEVLAQVAPLQASSTAQVEQISVVKSELSALAETLDQQQIAVEQAQAALEVRQKESAKLLADRTAAQERLLDVRAQTSDHESRLEQLGERRHELQEGKTAYEAASRSLEGKARALHGDLTAIEAQLQATSSTGLELAGQRAQQEDSEAAIRKQQQDLVEERNQLDQRLGRLRERYELLTRMREEGADLYDGVRSVMRFARDPEGAGRRLKGIVGTVAELIEVPRELEAAIEVALGGQLQDIVVESWQDARAAIEHLKRTRGGRATFLPLDALRPARPVARPRMGGVLGLASVLVECEPRLRPVVNYLLGRTIVCRDSSAARQVLGSLRGSYQIVTLEGELARSSGAVTGGAGKHQRRGGLLAREREWRELPEQLEDLQKKQRSLQDSIQDLAARERSIAVKIATLAAQQKELDAAYRAYEKKQAKVQQQLGQAERERDWHRSLVAQSERGLGELDEREADLRQKLDDLEAQVRAVESELEDLQAQIDPRDDQDLRTELAAQLAEMALMRQRQASKQAELLGHERSLHQIEMQIEDGLARADGLAEQLTHAEREIGELRQREDVLRVELEAYADRIRPVEKKVARLEDRQAQFEAEESEARTRLQALESRHSHTQVEAARQEDHMNNLQRQIMTDLGLVELDMGEELSGQPLLPLGSFVSSLPEVEVLPEGLEEQMRALRRRLRRLEPVNPDAPAEYEETRQRHDFLSDQAQDLERATAHLRDVVAELDVTMEREFKRTFDAVAREFRTYFRRLFTGGSARLQLTDPDDLMSTGIDIVARPPGKRQQGLALLSGGERALIAAALIFSILKVSPTPFCVLDEVDATLDEANVGRFRAVLKSLSRETQFVVITHNRYTIEVADIVYGVSMGADGTSCVISHRLSQQSV